MKVFDEGGLTFAVDFVSLADKPTSSDFADSELSCSLPRRDFIAVSIGAVLRPFISLGGFIGGAAPEFAFDGVSIFGETGGKLVSVFGGGGGGLGGLFGAASDVLI